MSDRERRVAAFVLNPAGLIRRLELAEEFIRSVVEYDEYRDDYESPDRILGRIEAKAREYFREFLAERDAKEKEG